MTSSLLSRLEALTSPSREIDAEIALANAWKRIPPPAGLVGTSDWCSPKDYVYGGPPFYTASIDTTLTLLPEGCDWAVCLCGDSYAAVVDMDPTGYVGDLLHGPGASFAATPAIAVLIAIMKAKEESPALPSKDKP
jgi:hypothetical protein